MAARRSLLVSFQLYSINFLYITDAPVFKPFIATKLTSLQINPHIASMSPVLIQWDVTQPAPNHVDFQDEPLTAPRVTELNVVSKSIPWPLKLKESPFLRAGVTVADFLSMLSLVMRAPLRDVDLDAFTEEERNTFLTFYRRRCPEGDDPHRVYDLLLGSTLFSGLAYDEGYANEQSREYWNIHLRATFLPKPTEPSTLGPGVMQ